MVGKADEGGERRLKEGKRPCP